MMYEFLTGDVRDVLADMPAGHFDAVLCDPPYGLAFMGKRWDYDVPGPELWGEVLRVLKPGAHLMAFGGSRTYHRLAVAIEDSGAELRDVLMWLYGSGFPKSHAIGKAIDKAAGAEREVVGSKAGRPGYREGDEAGQDVYSAGLGNGSAKCAITAPTTPEAARWEGHGTALKPAYEPVILAIKPLDGTYAGNALAYGVAGLNIEAGRIGDEARVNPPAGNKPGGASYNMSVVGMPPNIDARECAGRWPANVILGDESADALGEPSRFFYCAKASRRERGEGNTHPTVKPIDLARYLAGLLLPPARIDGQPRRILVPFSGSGSEVIGCLLAGWDEVVGIEREPEYVGIAHRRVSAHVGLLAREAVS